MPESSLPPPPPRPPSSIPPPPPPTSRLGGSGWRDATRPPEVPYPPDSRWGLGDAAIATLLWAFSSVALFVLIVFVFDADPTDGWWLPVALVLPQLIQFGFVWWTARARGSGLAIDFGLAFRWTDLGVGAMLFVVGLVAAAVVGLLMIAVGIDPPTAAVAEITEEAVEGPDASHDDSVPFDAPGGDAPSDPADRDGEGSGITAPIILVAVLAATVVPLVEELGYRGLWYSALLKGGHSEWWAIGLSSLVFALIHLEPARTPIILVLGFVLGWGRRLTNRIGASIIAHAAINGLAFAVLLSTL